MLLETLQLEKLDRNELIKSYGFVEQLSSNENFLQESLELASRMSGTTYAYISLLDNEKQYILSQAGATLTTMNVQDSICQHAIKSDDVLIITDTREDARTKSLPIVNKKNGVVFYAGCPLVNNENERVGALCLMDNESKTLSQTQQDVLKLLAKQIMVTLDNQRDMIKLIKKINTNFKPAACANLSCLTGELMHLQDEVVTQNQIVKIQKEELENSNKKLTEFAHIVAHDVRAPLRTISTFINLHERGLQVSSIPYEKEHIAFIKQAATNLDELTQSLLSYAKAGKDSNEKETLNLNQVLGLAVLNLTDAINKSNAKVELPENNFLISGQKSPLIQLFQNLISNGIKYQSGEEAPLIKIQTLEEEDNILIQVIDNGIGISEENLAKVFEPFKRLHNSSEYSGSGIGLATCKKIVDNMGSDFTLTSELGKGSTFSFKLPKH